MNNFLPEVKVTTIVWGDANRLQSSKWEAAQGDDLKNNRATIEINLPRIVKKRGSLDNKADRIIENWLAIYVILATRQDLINKHIRGALSTDAEPILYRANFQVIKKSPMLQQKYASLAAGEITNGTWYLDSQYKGLWDQLVPILITKQEAKHRSEGER